MTVDQAFDHFDSHVRARSLAVPIDEVEATGDRKVEFSQDGTGFRLLWDEGAGILSLNITHGPPNEPPVGWLDLYCAVRASSGRLQPNQHHFDFAEAVDYGLSLFMPAV